MPATFSHTLRSLQADTSRRWGSTVFLSALLAAGLAWFFLGRVGVHEVTAAARLEAQARAHLLQELAGLR